MPKARRICVAFALAVILFSTQQSFAWIDAGHKIVALLAWEDLTPKTRAAVVELLKQHPRFEKDLLLELPDGSTPEASDRYAFATAAVWPDMVRMQGHPMHATYNHPAWHYIDIPFVQGGKAPPASQPSGPGPHDVVEALAQCTTELKDPAIPAAQKAIDLCWINHLVGDIHQPLHAVVMISPDFPDGDKGGNDEFVLRDPPYPNSRNNLHLIWDSLPGDFKTQLMDGYVAAGLHADPQFSRAKLQPLIDVKEFMAWAQESHALAVEYAYLNGQLKSATARRGRSTAADTASTPGLPPDYLAKAEPVAMHQVALAGYRLADLLNSIFDPKP